MKTLSRKKNRSDTITELKKENTGSILKKQKQKQNKVLIIYTGGTIGCQKTADGLSPVKGFLFEYLKNHSATCDKEQTKLKNPDFNPKDCLITPETEFHKHIEYSIFEFETVVDSSSILAEDWVNIGSVITENYSQFDAFVVLHGTDTMHNTAAMLSFLLENLNKTVIITGSQVPLFEQSNDGIKNLINALVIAGTYSIPEVTLCFNNSLFRGNRCVKYDSVNFDAFASPNLPPLAIMDSEIKVRWDLILPPPRANFSFSKKIDQNVSLVKFFPTISSLSFSRFFESPTKAVVIESYGSGTLPENREDIFNTIEAACKKGIVVCIVSQCFIGGAKAMYSASVLLERMGVLYCGDIKPEAAIAKLCYLLGKNISLEKVKKYMLQDIRGEMSVKNKEFFSERRNSMIDAMLKIFNVNNRTQDAYNKAVTLLPSMFQELTERNNIQMLTGLSNEIKEIYSKRGHETTPLHVACRKGNLELVKLMLQCKINENYVDAQNKRPLFYAIQGGHNEIVDLLVKRGAFICSDSFTASQLCYMAKKGKIEILRLYFENGGNLLAEDYDQETCFHVAAHCGLVSLFELVDSKGNLDYEKPNKWGKTPMDLAQRKVREYFNKRQS